nr:LysR family transcriptional regulator [Maliibacterium massiliense]
MDLKQLRGFIAMAEEGSMTGAARKLFVAQSALSAQLKRLEQEMGTELMQRGARRLTLTDAGRILYNRAKRIIELADATSKEIGDYARGLAGTLYLGMTPSTALTLFDGHLSAFHERYPDIQYQLYEANTAEIVALLTSGVVEVGIVRTPFKTAEIDALYAKPEPMAAAFNPQKISLPGRDGDWIPLQALRDAPVCVLRRFEELLSAACLKNGFMPRTVSTNSQMLLNIMWARYGLGISIAPASAFRSGRQGEGLCYRLIDDASLYTRRAVISMRGRYLSGPGRMFLEMCRDLEG